ncbi:hypothetical protein JCM19238_3042 [Vibrio ponticus]|nr:hypothetical protein JCM19238_3042 [Vibrio ponticus]
MNKKLSLLAVSVAMVLAGCGSDDSSSANSAQQTGQFIDAKVKGLYFEAQPSGLSGWTNENGEYQSKANDTITFYLGGKDGLKIGASSERGANGIITPFESMGKYDRAVTLARILQSLDADGDTTNDSIEIPETLTTNISEQALMAVNLIQLDDFNSATKLFDVLGIPTRVSESDATDHMEAAFGSTLRGGDDAIPQFALDTNKVIRQISVTQSLKTSPDAANSILYVHADKTLSDDLFNKTRGMDAMMFKFNSDKLVVLAGTNDGSLSEETAERYLKCVSINGIWKKENNIYNCNGSPATDNSGFDLGSSKFEYKLINKESELKVDKEEAWDTVPEAGPIGCATTEGGCTANKLNTMTDNVRDDSDAQDGSAWQREVESGSYDPVTGIHTVVRQKVECSSEQLDDCTGRTTTYLEYYYEVPDATTERYVDFNGTWNVVTTKPNCDLIARSTMTFSASGYSVKGHDLHDSGSSCSLSEMDESGTWSELPLDYWWFNQANRETKATLTELNSVVRWCDIKGYDADSMECKEGSDDKRYFNKWEYQPAGKEWDQGILTNRKMLSNGQTIATHYMQKVK